MAGTMSNSKPLAQLIEAQFCLWQYTSSTTWAVYTTIVTSTIQLPAKLYTLKYILHNEK